MKALTKITCVLLISVGFLCAASAQTKKADRKAAKIAEISKMIADKSYVFKANFANPSRGMPARSLTSDYDLTVSRDTIVAYLPYFGRAYLADYNSSTEGGIKFSGTHFDYKVTENKKGNREVLITPKDSKISDPRAVQSLRLNITPDGYASLQVISYNRDPISFDGTIEAKK